MSDEERSLRGRVEILRGYATALADPVVLLELCGTGDGGVRGARARLRAAFDLSEMQADAVLTLQLRRFVPEERQRILDELAEAERGLRDLDG